MKNSNEIGVKRICEYMDKMGVSYSINDNPTPEEIERIKKQIKKTEAYRKRIISHKDD